jgi:cell division protein FtsL
MAMRKFSEFEENIIKKMVAATEIRELSLAKLIDENSPAIALEWNLEKPSFTVFYRSFNGTENELFFQIQEIISLLKYLEDERYIYLSHRPGFVKDNRLYNTKKYGRDDNGEYHFLMGNGAKGKIKDWRRFEFFNDFGSSVQQFANGFFYASNALRDLVENDFKTPEQRRFEKQLKDTNTKHEEAMGKARDQVKYSRWAFYGSIAAFLSSLLFGIIQMCSDTTINKSQIEQIKQSIEQKTLPEVFKTEITNDTLTTKVVEMPKVKSTIQSK